MECIFYRNLGKHSMNQTIDKDYQVEGLIGANPLPVL